ncbi:hypothetical protein V6N11_000482 [Hibiscus sabdariffa]|uniref:Transcription factor CBF/NF-Y/archaeal histone domain-containing protein n=1 Tax=Hibiscus sabdariffa TaxID=183260 RepID=A0ABR2NT24_9ROSI
MLQLIPDNLACGRSSHLWKVVCSVWEIVRLNVVWNIGDRQQVDFWYDSWLGSLGPLAGYVRNMADIAPCNVAAMVDELGNWDWPRLQSLLPQSVLLHLSATKPPRSGFKGDFPGWARSHDRTFSVRTAYEALRDSSVQSANAVWKVIAGFRGLQRIKIFIWLLAKEKLLCNAERVRRHLSNCSRCEACGAALESIYHIFRGCPIAVAVWKGLIKRDKWVEFMSLDTMEWIRGNLSSNSSFAVDSVDWDLRFGAILWCLWLRRYAMIFDPENLDMFAVSDRSIWLWKDMQSAYVLEGQDRPNHASRADSLQSSRAVARSSMADGTARGPTSPAGGSHESGGEQSSSHSNAREQDRYLPIANISRIMKKALPANGKISKEAKDTVQECVSEFISFITSEASDKCQKEKRKTINGDDLLWAMATLGFEDYIEPLKLYLARYREGDAKGSARGGEGSSLQREAVGVLAVPNPQS